MKNITYKFIALFIVSAFAMQSCGNWADPELNISPNSPADVNMPDLLPQIQVGSAFTIGGDFARFSMIPMQHMTGANRQSFAFERYVINESDVNNLWNTSYITVLKNASILLSKAEELNAPHYAGVARVLTAHRLGLLSAAWGDIPYSDALKGDEGNLEPGYDSQEQIYSTIQSLLDQAITNLSSDPGPLVPGSADLIYGGNAAKWLKFANSLKAKFHLHLSKRNGYAPVLAALGGDVINDNADNARFNFGSNANEWNPIYQFDLERDDIRASSTIMDKMKEVDDPRMSAYFSLFEGEFVGSDLGSGNLDASRVGPFYASQNSPVFFMTHAEVKFIEAEAKFQTGDAGGAAEAYNAGVIASLAQHNASNPDWEAENANEDAGSITLEKIMNAKYIALYLNTEVWTDWRRTGLPNLEVVPNPGTPDDQIPRRFVYPLSERLYNGSNMPEGQLQNVRVWWDQ